MVEAVLCEGDAGEQKAGEHTAEAGDADINPDADWNIHLVHQKQPLDGSC